MTFYTIVYVALGVIVILGILATVWVCIAEKWEKKIKRKSVESIIDRDRKVIK